MSKEIFVIKSFENDLNNFIDEFISLDEEYCNFNKFSLIWKSKKFYLIFQGKKIREILIFFLRII